METKKVVSEELKNKSSEIKKKRRKSQRMMLFWQVFSRMLNQWLAVRMVKLMEVLHNKLICMLIQELGQKTCQKQLSPACILSRQLKMNNTVGDGSVQWLE
jgi:hypothetical protein